MSLESAGRRRRSAVCAKTTNVSLLAQSCRVWSDRTICDGPFWDGDAKKRTFVWWPESATAIRRSFLGISIDSGVAVVGRSSNFVRNSSAYSDRGR